MLKSMKLASILDFGGHFELKIWSNHVSFIFIQFLTHENIGVETKIIILDLVVKKLWLAMRKKPWNWQPSWILAAILNVALYMLDTQTKIVLQILTFNLVPKTKL